jgi:hypothetical protein
MRRPIYLQNAIRVKYLFYSTVESGIWQTLL